MGVGGGGRKEHTGGPDKGKQKSGTRAGSGPQQAHWVDHGQGWALGKLTRMQTVSLRGEGERRGRQEEHLRHQQAHLRRSGCVLWGRDLLRWDLRDGMGLNQVRGGEERKEMRRREWPGHTRLCFCEILPVPSEELTEVRGFKWEEWQQRYVYFKGAVLCKHTWGGRCEHRATGWRGAGLNGEQQEAECYLRGNLAAPGDESDTGGKETWGLSCPRQRPKGSWKHKSEVWWVPSYIHTSSLGRDALYKASWSVV